MRIFALLLISAISLASSSAFAATLNVVGGQLMGASNVLVDGSLYDVQFLDGTCIDLYNGCDEVSDITFQTQASALLASQALLDQVFLDGVQGQFDSEPELTNGCSQLILCGANTPFYLDLAQQSLRYARVRNYDSDSDTVSIIASSLHFPENSTYDTSAVYAVWSNVVPEPSSALLLGLGLTGLAAKGRRRNRS